MNNYSKYPNVLMLNSILSIFLMGAFLNSAYAEKMVVKKVTLARFQTKDSSIINLPKTSPYWPQVNRHILTVDDRRNIYLLNLWNNEIMVFNSFGKLYRKIKLEIRMSRKEYLNGNLEVSGDGKRFIVHGYDYSRKIVQFVFDQDGKVIYRFSEKEAFFSFPDIRLCNGKYVFLQGRSVYDESFHILKEEFTGFFDLEGRYTFGKNNALIKISKDGKQLWGKQFDGNFEIIGVDKNDYVYIEGRLRKGDPNSLYKVNSKGDILAQAPIPDPFPFLTKEEKDELEMHSSDDYYTFFKLACNGDLYLIHSLNELPERTFQRWLKGGEYFIYKFETKK